MLHAMRPLRKLTYFLLQRQPVRLPLNVVQCPQPLAVPPVSSPDSNPEDPGEELFGESTARSGARLLQQEANGNTDLQGSTASSMPLGASLSPRAAWPVLPHWCLQSLSNQPTATQQAPRQDSNPEPGLCSPPSRGQPGRTPCLRL